MKILSWNINRRGDDRAFRHAIETEQADLVLFQECFHPLTYLTTQELQHLSNRYLWQPTRNGWGNCILTKHANISEVTVEHAFKGRLLVSTATFPAFGELTIINLHTPITDGYSRHNLKKMFQGISDHVRKGNTIICGDLNMGEWCDKNGETEHKEILDGVLQEHSIIDCYRKFHRHFGQTFRPCRKPDSKICNDYIFVSKNLESRVKTCRILDGKKIKEMSDHNPLVAVME